MTANKRSTGSDLKRVDEHEIRPEEYDDVPELTEAWFEKASLHHAGKPVRRGRPRSETPKQQVTLRLDRDVLDRFRATGAGWQSRINEALRKAVGS